MAHWYEAQLIHYGLPRSKDKNTAKVRLTSAISAGLAVPADIVRTEAELKKQYASAVRKANTATSMQSEVALKGKKRKADQAGGGTASSTSVSFSFADGTTMDVNHQAGAAAKAAGYKKSKADSTPVKEKKPKAKIVTPSKAIAKETPKRTKKSSATKPSAAAASRPAFPQAASQHSAPASAPRPKQTARRSKPFHYPTNDRTPTGSSQPIYDHTPSSFHDLESDEDDAPPAYDSLDFDDQHSPPESSNIGQISGLYLVDVPNFSDSVLCLCIDKSTNELWGEFTIGPKVVILRMNDADGLATQESKTFAWRAEDTETGSFDFRRGCEGDIRFDANGRVSGSLYGLVYRQVVDFDGSLENEYGAPGDEYYRDQWEKIPRMAYGRN